MVEPISEKVQGGFVGFVSTGPPHSQSRIAPPQLIEAAMRACVHYGDGQDARQVMIDDVLALPEHLRADLLAYLRQRYGTNSGDMTN